MKTQTKKRIRKLLGSMPEHDLGRDDHFVLGTVYFLASGFYSTKPYLHKISQELKQNLKEL